MEQAHGGGLHYDRLISGGNGADTVAAAALASADKRLEFLHTTFPGSLCGQVHIWFIA